MSTHTAPSSKARTMDFGGLSICFDKRIIEPRPWTAAQSRWAAELLDHLPDGPVLELCCGAGHIGLMAVRDQDRQLAQIDIDPIACHYATLNAERAHLSGRVQVRCGPMQDALAPQESFALIIADPPYLPSASVSQYPQDPRQAIDGGQGGFDLIADCLSIINTHLAVSGAALLQVSNLTQARDLEKYLVEHSEMRLARVDERDCHEGALVHITRSSVCQGITTDEHQPGSP